MDYSSPADRRKDKRVEDIFTVTYRLRETIDVKIKTPDEKQYTGVAVDISAGGIGVVVTQKIPAGTRLHLKFTLVNTLSPSDTNRQRTFELTGQSRHCQPTHNGAFRAGILFDDINAEQSTFINEYVRVELLKKTNA